MCASDLHGTPPDRQCPQRGYVTNHTLHGIHTPHDRDALLAAIAMQCRSDRITCYALIERG